MAYGSQGKGSIGTGAGVKRQRVFEGNFDRNRSSSTLGGIPRGVLK
jgi:hypothetical protein